MTIPNGNVKDADIDPDIQRKELDKRIRRSQEELKKAAEERNRKREEEIKKIKDFMDAEEKSRQEVNQRAAWIRSKKCRHCGGDFVGGLFSKTCSSCGKKKDY